MMTIERYIDQSKDHMTLSKELIDYSESNIILSARFPNGFEKFIDCPKKQIVEPERNKQPRRTELVA